MSSSSNISPQTAFQKKDAVSQGGGTYSASNGWILYYSEDGYPYYYNATTKESVWAQETYPLPTPVVDDARNDNSSSSSSSSRGNWKTTKKGGGLAKSNATLAPEVEKEEESEEESEEDDDDDDSSSESSDSESDDDDDDDDEASKGFDDENENEDLKDNQNMTLDPKLEEKFRAYLRTPAGIEAMRKEQERLQNSFKASSNYTRIDDLFSSIVNSINWAIAPAPKATAGATAVVAGVDPDLVSSISTSADKVNKNDPDVQTVLEPTFPRWLWWSSIKSNALYVIQNAGEYINSNTLNNLTATGYNYGRYAIDVVSSTAILAFQTGQRLITNAPAPNDGRLPTTVGGASSDGASSSSPAFWQKVNGLLVDWVGKTDPDALANMNGAASARVAQPPLPTTPRTPSTTPRPHPPPANSTLITVVANAQSRKVTKQLNFDNVAVSSDMVELKLDSGAEQSSVVDKKAEEDRKRQEYLAKVRAEEEAERLEALEVARLQEEGRRQAAAAKEAERLRIENAEKKAAEEEIVRVRIENEKRVAAEEAEREIIRIEAERKAKEEEEVERLRLENEKRVAAEEAEREIIRIEAERKAKEEEEVERLRLENEKRAAAEDAENERLANIEAGRLATQKAEVDQKDAGKIALKDTDADIKAETVETEIGPSETLTSTVVAETLTVATAAETDSKKEGGQGGKGGKKGKGKKK